MRWEGVIPFGTYAALRACPDERFLPLGGGGLTPILRFRASDKAGGTRKRSKMDDGLLVLVLVLVLQLPDTCTSLSAEYSLV